MQPPIFSCSHPVYFLPINNDYTTIKREDGTSLITGLCRACCHAHSEENHRLLKEYWLGRIEEKRRAIMTAKDRLWFNHDDELAAWTTEAEKLLDAWVLSMERELRGIWQEFEWRWGE